MGLHGKEDLIPGIPAENGNVQKRPRFFETVRHKIVQCFYVYNEVFGPPLQRAHELVGNNKINYNTHNVKLINVYGKE